jgi:hypothetical protein
MGWLPMLLRIIAILATRYRDAVRLPEVSQPNLQASGTPLFFAWPATRRDVDQELH